MCFLLKFYYYRFPVKAFIPQEAKTSSNDLHTETLGRVGLKCSNINKIRKFVALSAQRKKT